MQEKDLEFRLTPAHLRWQGGSPISDTFGDIYFNPDEGADESEYVFIGGNNLHERWQQTPDRFTIAETGFGTGLNFLLTRRLWLEQSNPNQRLCYISCERYPLTRNDLHHALNSWPELADGALQLEANWPPACQGNYLLELDGGRISLLLLFGDGIERYSQLNAQVDAWFLDGFSPTQNERLWHADLFTQIARLSHSGTTLATFTAAGFVRRNLQAAGFNVEKRAGFGIKREMITATRAPGSHTDPDPASRPWHRRAPKATGSRHAVIIGAGLAGAFTASELARRGWKVDVVERHSKPAEEGSGNRQGAFYLKLPTRPNPMLQLHLAGFHFSAGQLKKIAHTEPDLASNCGLLDLASTPKAEEQQQKLAASGLYPDTLVRPVDAAKASALAGVPLTTGGLYLPDSGWAAPAALTQHLLQHPGIRCHYDTEIHRLERDSIHENWRLNDGQFIAPTVILCTAAQTDPLTPYIELPLKEIRGQTSVAEAPSNLAPISTVICADGYISPPQDNLYCFGASFSNKDPDLELRPSDHESNLSMLRQTLPQLAEGLANCPLAGHVAMRASTPDYLPLVGPVADQSWMIKQFSKLRDDAKWPHFSNEMQHLPGLFVNAGHGAKGLITIPYSAHLIADMIDGSPLIAEQSLIEALNPLRFVIKKLIKQSI